MFIVLLVCLLQHPYVYLVLIFEAFATFIGQLSVLSLIALFGAATTAMVSASFEFPDSFAIDGSLSKLQIT